jgi:predicted ATPase
VKLICSAESKGDELFVAEKEEGMTMGAHEEKFMFARAVSRLHEMSSVQYLESAHRPN